MVVAAGASERLPRVATGPIAGAIDSENAFSASQRRVTDSPGLIVAGAASKRTISAGGPAGALPGNPAGGGA